MRTSVVTCSTLILIAAGTLFLGAAPVPPNDRGVDEVARVRVHLDRAVRFLETYQPADLNSSQLVLRTQVVAALGDYRDRGVFPHNHGPEPIALFFVDDHGTPCALASLILGSGRADIVEAVRARMNHAWVYQIMEDPDLGPVLVDWLDTHGLTVADAATIQVPGYTAPLNPSGGNQSLSTEFAVVSGASLGLSAATTTVNLLNFQSGGRVPAWLGLVSGAASVGVGIAAIDVPGAQRTVASIDIVGGVVTLATSAVRLLRGFESGTPNPEALTPVVRPDADGRARLGLRLAF